MLGTLPAAQPESPCPTQSPTPKASSPPPILPAAGLIGGASAQGQDWRCTSARPRFGGAPAQGPGSEVHQRKAQVRRRRLFLARAVETAAVVTAGSPRHLGILQNPGLWSVSRKACLPAAEYGPSPRFESRVGSLGIFLLHTQDYPARPVLPVLPVLPVFPLLPFYPFLSFLLNPESRSHPSVLI